MYSKSSKGLRFLAGLLALALVLTFALPMTAFAEEAQENKILSINAHVGDYSESSKNGFGANISFATKTDGPGKLQVKKGDVVVFEESLANGRKDGDPYFDRKDHSKVDHFTNDYVYTYQFELRDLEADTLYTYTVEALGQTQKGQFKTAIGKNQAGHVRFAYLGDPQVHNSKHGEATGAIFNLISEISAKNPLDFIYIAGDHTDKGYEVQSKVDTPKDANDKKASGLPFGHEWEDFFNNKGQYPNATQKALLNHLLLSTQGNHDTTDFNGRINVPDPIYNNEKDTDFVKGVYSYVAGPMKFIILNNASYETQDLANNANFQKMMAYLKQEVKSAKEEGLWTVVGFHKPLYTGASHISDDDVAAYRKAMNKVFTDLDIDLVLNGHDHVYSRGFINAQGEKATQANTAAEGNVFYHVKNAPFHMVSEHAGGLKWYEAVDYTKDITKGDPLTPDYKFLDKNGAKEVPPSSEKKDTTVVIVDMTADRAEFTTYKLHYDQKTSKVDKEAYIYDRFIVLRRQAPQRVAGSTRLETALANAQAYQKADTVLIARSDDFADALSASVYAKLLKAPILLSKTDFLYDGVKTEIARLGAKKAILVGGDKALSMACEKELKDIKGLEVSRIDGTDRYETSVKLAGLIAKANKTVDGVYVATGTNFADALAVSPLAAGQVRPILLTRPDALPQSVKDGIKSLGVKNVTILGGKKAVSQAVAATLPGASRLEGETRYETSVMIAGKMAEAKLAYLATGEEFADALVAGPVAAEKQAPILLVQPKKLPDAVASYLKKSKIKEVIVLGGDAAVDDAVASGADNLIK